EPPGRRDQPRVDPRAPHDPRLRDGGSARAGHRPRVPPQGRARRRAVRARPAEQGQGVGDPMTPRQALTSAALRPTAPGRAGAKVALFEEATAPAVTEAARGRGVKDVAVAGEADERLGERVAAFVVPGAGVTAEELDRFCRESPDLASFKRPRRFVFVKEIPKTASGKILRRLLREGRYTE